MDLTAVPGIGPEYSRRLQEAGVPDVAALASASDLPALAEKTGIPLPRLTAIHDAAVDMTEESGIVMTTVQPFQEVAQTLWRAVEDARSEVAGRVERVESALRGRALEAVDAMEKRLAAMRAALASRPPKAG